MARNEEKHYGRLNRLYLLAEKKKYDEAHPIRPKLDSLHSVEEIQKWLPSIKQDLDFYLKKSQVTCYSEQHINECRETIVRLEKEFKAFVRKIKQLSPVTTDPIPWTSRAYKRKFIDDPIENKDKSLFEPIPCPILEQEISKKRESPLFLVNTDLMDKPLCFKTNLKEKENCEHLNIKQKREYSAITNSTQPICINESCIAPPTSMQKIVDYEYSSDSDCN